MRTISSLLPSSLYSTRRMFSVQPPPPAASQQQEGEEKSWYSAFPTPKSSLSNGTLSSITVSQLLEKIKQQSDLKKGDYLVVDVRRTDFEVSLYRSNIEPLKLTRRTLRERWVGCLHSRSSKSTCTFVLSDARLPHSSSLLVSSRLPTFS